MWAWLRSIFGQRPADVTAVCPHCNRTDTLRGFASWEMGGVRGLRGKLASGHIVIACPACGGEFKYDSLSGEYAPLVAEDKVVSHLTQFPERGERTISAGELATDIVNDFQTVRILVGSLEKNGDITARSGVVFRELSMAFLFSLVHTIDSLNLEQASKDRIVGQVFAVGRSYLQRNLCGFDSDEYLSLSKRRFEEYGDLLSGDPSGNLFFRLGAAVDSHISGSLDPISSFTIGSSLGAEMINTKKFLDKVIASFDLV